MGGRITIKFIENGINVRMVTLPTADLQPLPVYIQPPQAIKLSVPPLPGIRHVRMNIPNALPVQFRRNSDLIVNYNLNVKNNLNNIARNLKANPNLIVHIVGNSSNTSDMYDRTVNNIHGVDVAGTIRDLMIARARAVERLLVTEYNVDPRQIRVRVGKINSNQNTQFIYKLNN